VDHDRHPRARAAGGPGDGTRLTWTGITIFRLANEQVVERWANVDILAILQQMGVVPPPPAGP